MRGIPYRLTPLDHDLPAQAVLRQLSHVSRPDSARAFPGGLFTKSFSWDAYLDWSNLLRLFQVYDLPHTRTAADRGIYKRLDSGDRLRYRVPLDEVVLHRVVGGLAVMIAQLSKILDRANPGR
jgi:Domain of unknown function (DUF5753)